jgi:anti-sigma B factor antagonist
MATVTGWGAPRPGTDQEMEEIVLFDVQCRDQEGWTVLAIVGDLDLAAVPRVRQVAQQIRPPARAGHPPQVIIDLSSTDFIDSAGLGVVLGVVRRARVAGGRAAVVAGADSPTGRLFVVLGLDRVITVASSVEDLMAAPVAAGSNGAGSGPLASGGPRHG